MSRKIAFRMKKMRNNGNVKERDRPATLRNVKRATKKDVNVTMIADALKNLEGGKGRDAYPNGLFRPILGPLKPDESIEEEDKKCSRDGSNLEGGKIWIQRGGEWNDIG
jgi:hypothetical protein